MTKKEFDNLWAIVCGGTPDTPKYIQQNPTELWETCQLLTTISPKRLLEIGNFCGGTTLFWRAIASTVSIDLTPPEKTEGGGTVTEGNVLGHLLTDVEFIIGDSHSNETLEKARKFSPYDFLFIDGDHSVVGVQKDYDMYAPLIRRGGLVAFHDWCYSMGPEGMPIQKCIKSTGIEPHLIIHTTGFGIAVLRIP